ncbi:MAG: hypothetical protein Q8S01_12955, partial [Ignavibacteria bacterium]|nr:hypothetical protein [Ignavibacteria bacterium]
MKKVLLLIVISILFFNSCKKDEGNPVSTPPAPTYNTTKDVNSSQGGNISLGDSIVLSIPALALPNNGSVFLGRTGKEPTNVPNTDYAILGTPITIKIPADSINKPISLSFPKGNNALTTDDICTFIYNGNSYFPIQSTVQNDQINVTIDNINWETSYSLKKKTNIQEPQVLTELVIVVLILKQVPQAVEMGLKEVAISNGALTYSTTTANSSSKIVLLIHGWISRPNVWKSIVTRLKAETNPNYTNIWTFGYNSSLSVEANADILYQALSTSTKGVKVDIIGHSMGGLVARSMIEKYNGAQFVNKLITLGTPHLGSPLAAIRGWLGSIIKTTNPKYFTLYNYFTQGFRDLEPNSLLIQNLKTLTSPTVPYYLIAGI